MISKIRSIHRGFFFHTTWTVPFALLVLTILSYGLRALSLGFYWDDWPYLWFFNRLGAEGITQAFSGDRPFLSLTYITTLSFLGHSAPAWQAFALLTHWLYSLGFWWMLSQTWPGSRHKAAWAAFLFAVYPGFTGHWISVIYGQAFLLFSFVFFSIGLTLFLARRRHTLRKGWLAAGTLLALLLSAFTMYSTEYFFGVELLRPVLLLIVLWASSGEPEISAWVRARKQVLRAALWWAPYLALMVSFVVWRGFIHVFQSYQLTTIEGIEQSPLDTLRGLLLTVTGDLIESSLAAWGQTLQLSGILEASPVVGLRWIALTLFTGLVVTVYLSRLCPEEDRLDPAAFRVWPWRLSWAWQAVLVGLLAFLFAGVPFWITGLPMRLGFPQDRFSLMLSIGVCLIAAGLIDALGKGLFQKAALIGILTALAVGFHFNTSYLYREDWNAVRSFFWQLAWRAPNLQDDTLVMTADMPFRFFEDDSLTAPLNWTYDPETNSGEMKYVLFDVLVRQSSLHPAEPGRAINKDFRAVSFRGSTSQMIAVHYQPPGCVKVLDPVYDADYYDLPDHLLRMLPLSNPSQQIQPAGQPAMPPEEVFGEEPQREWCYYYQKAELARQLGDWRAILELEKQSIGRGYRPADAYEYIPFIEANARLWYWPDAYQLTATAYQQTRDLRPALCAAWRRAIPDQETAQSGPQDALANVQALLNCSIP